MKAETKEYTYPSSSIIKNRSLIHAADINDLRENVTSLLKAYQNHVGTRNPEDGGSSELDENKRQHAIVSSTVAGFSPRNIDNLLEKAGDDLRSLRNIVQNDCYPELSIAIWYGPKVPSSDLPKGWLFCDGTEVLYTIGEGESAINVYTPNLTYTEVVAASQDLTTETSRGFCSVTYGQKRESIGSSGSTSNLGEAVSKWYIIKKPAKVKVKAAINLKVTQPIGGIRIDTSYTTAGDINYIRSLEDGSIQENNNVPENSTLRYNVLTSDNYNFLNLYVKHSSSGKIDTLISPGTLTTQKGDNLEFYAEVERIQYKFTIKGTTNQVITVISGGKTYKSEDKDVTFKLNKGDTWSVTITPNDNYIAGSIIGDTQGIVSGNYIIDSTSAIPKTLTTTDTTGQEVRHSTYNGCLLIGEEFNVTKAKKVKVELEFYFTGYTDTEPNWTFSGYGFMLLPEKYYTLNSGGKLTENVWDEYTTGEDNGGHIFYNNDILAKHPWVEFFQIPGQSSGAGYGSSGNFGNKCFSSYCITGDNSYTKYSAEAEIIIPAGKSHLAVVYNASASRGDTAKFYCNKCISRTYSCKATITLLEELD